LFCHLAQSIIWYGHGRQVIRYRYHNNSHSWFENFKLGFTETILETSLELDTTMRLVEAAFLPLRCVATHLHHHRVRFEIFAVEKNTSLLTAEVPGGRVHDREALSFILGDARRRIEAMGYALDPWVAPNEEVRES
jgi:hypothetical protein